MTESKNRPNRPRGSQFDIPVYGLADGTWPVDDMRLSVGLLGTGWQVREASLRQHGIAFSSYSKWRVEHNGVPGIPPWRNDAGEAHLVVDGESRVFRRSETDGYERFRCQQGWGIIEIRWRPTEEGLPKLRSRTAEELDDLLDRFRPV
jgi:hypothetical protein